MNCTVFSVSVGNATELSSRLFFSEWCHANVSYWNSFNVSPVLRIALSPLNVCFSSGRCGLGLSRRDLE